MVFAYLFIISFFCGLCQADIIMVEEGQSIQAAIDRACAGDTIEIKKGSFEESLEVNKRLTIQGKDGDGMPTITGDVVNRSAITLSADGCTLRGLMIIDSGNCALNILSDFNTVKSNTIVSSNTGIILKSSRSNIIEANRINTAGSLSRSMLILHSLNNTITGNNLNFFGVLANGIDIFSSDQNAISDNNIKGNGLLGGGGVSCHDSHQNIFRNNSIETRGLWGSSVYLAGSSGNVLDFNNVVHNDFSGSGITLSSSTNNELMQNTAKSEGLLNCDGIFLRHSDGNYIISNDVSGTGTYGSGVCLVYSDDNGLYSNAAQHNTYGIYLYSSHNNNVSDNIAQYNDDYGIYNGFYSANNCIINNTASLYIIEPHANYVERNHGKVKEFVITFPDQLPILTLSDMADLSFLITQFVLSRFDPR